MKQEIKSTERRAFMKKAGLGVGAVGAVAVALPKSSAAVVLGTGAKPGKSGYRETEHVKKYYEVARF